MTLDEKTSLVFSGISQPLICFWDATTEQLHHVYRAYIDLWASTTSEDHARAVFDSLITIALAHNKTYPITWLFAELQFEAFAAATGDRKWAALMELEHGVNEVNDGDLDLYNERITREIYFLD